MPISSFNPEEHLTKLPIRRKNQKTNTWESDYADYLEVKWRMVWFRENNNENTSTTIIDKIIDLQNKFAYFELEVIDSKGNKETGVGSETGADFGDYIEKAYTKAYGRALAALGYGTQFAPELNEGENIVDSPVKKGNEPSSILSHEEPITDSQRRAIFAIYNVLGLSDKQIKDIILKRYQKTDGKLLNKSEASDLIDYLNSMKAKSTPSNTKQPH